ncbi:FAD-dependent oxidoreductase [Hyphococcus formosus]|uniref:FAD-dependent oxidoreductase n=1 Tax=Hyphococcus formosus TaxID=3143534 RepID=UPI00398A8D66
MMDGRSASSLSFGYVRSPDQDGARPAAHQIIIVGGGLVGLTMAIDLASKGVKAVVLEKSNTLSEGSRSICQAKRTLEVWDRLGVGDIMLKRGVEWRKGKVFSDDHLLYTFDLQPEGGHKMPAFVNLQQYWVEQYLLERLLELGGEVRWCHEARSIRQSDDGVCIEVATPDGPYNLDCEWLIACDGARSDIRRHLGLTFDGRVFKDKFLITDVKMKGEFPNERWFWFDPSFHSGQTALLHRQADDIWRIDLQLGWEANAEEEKKLENVKRRIKAMLGDDAKFEIEWISVYVFQCRTLSDYVHGRVIFAGDSAHQVSPFGARGGNAGVQDADNLGWKMKLVLDGEASCSLLDTYSRERVYAARENILHSTRATDFITPKSKASRILRDQALSLAAKYPFAQKLVNSGRLSEPAHLIDTPLNTPDNDVFACHIAPGSPAEDAPLSKNGKEDWFLQELKGEFTVVAYEPNGLNLPTRLDIGGIPIAVKTIAKGAALDDVSGALRRRYDMKPGTAYLFRPDQHVAARWRKWSGTGVEECVERAAGRRI